MTKPDLGKLEQVDLREAWLSEPDDFTPWLADHLDLLGETLGLSLELEGTETSVGPFSADILCREVGDGHWVLIENQLERTDHTHLGQIVTYAAGLDALTIIWVAKEFVDEHRAAMDWLNHSTAEGLDFFGVEIELWRIGDSRMAPRLNIVSQPNAWSKGIVTPPGRFWNEEGFFADLVERCPAGEPAARSILEWAGQRGHPVRYGKGHITGAFVPRIAGAQDSYNPLIVYSDGKVGIEFVNIKVKPVFEDEAKREELRQRLNAIEGIKIPPRKTAGEPYVQLPLLADEARLRQFLEVWDWFVAEVGSADGEE